MSTRADALGRLEIEVGVLIRRVRRVIRERAEAVHPELVPATYLILTHLERVGPTRASAIADWFDIDKSAISRQTQHLIDLGLVTRTTDPDDRRAHVLVLTDDARVRLADVQSQRRAALDERLSDWTLPDLERMVDDLARYNASLDDNPR